MLVHEMRHLKADEDEGKIYKYAGSSERGNLKEAIMMVYNIDKDRKPLARSLKNDLLHVVTVMRRLGALLYLISKYTTKHASIKQAVVSVAAVTHTLLDWEYVSDKSERLSRLAQQRLVTHFTSPVRGIIREAGYSERTKYRNPLRTTIHVIPPNIKLGDIPKIDRLYEARSMASKSK
jgi:hypothetical protein